MDGNWSPGRVSFNAHNGNQVHVHGGIRSLAWYDHRVILFLADLRSLVVPLIGSCVLCTLVAGGQALDHVKVSSPTSYKFSRFVLEVAGGAILVPIFIHTVPAPLALDSFALALIIAFVLHTRFPIIRRVLKISEELKVAS